MGKVVALEAGDFVEWDDAKNVKRNGFAGICAGQIIDLVNDAGGYYACVRLSPGAGAKARGGGIWYVNSELLRPVSPAIAEKDRLFEAGCALCGKETDFRLGHDTGTGDPIPGSVRANQGYWVCRDCGGVESGVLKADAEITRRRALAANTQPVATQSVSVEAPKPDPYAVHNAKRPHDFIAAMTAKRDLRDTDKQRQAFRELDRGIKGPKYAYADSSVVFSSASWESD